MFLVCFSKICLCLKKLKQHLLSQQNSLLQGLSRVISHLGLVLTMDRGIVGHLSGPGDLPVALVQVDVGLVQEEGQDAGVESVCYEDFSHTHQSNGASKVLHVVKMFV